ncbi:MAG: hypothetical protein RTU92_08335, partial [Candidatus Thorarchaeota archaeon]
YFAIDADGQINSIGIVPVGIHPIEVQVLDTSNNVLSAIFEITVVDTTAPTWDETFETVDIEYGTRFICNLNATDLSDLGEWWVDDSDQFIVDWTGHVRSINTLELGDYALRVYVEDIYGNIVEISFIIEVRDTSPPTWEIAPVSQYIEEGSVFEYQLSAIDLSGIDQWSLNNTALFSISSTGLITSIGELASGHYSLTVIVSDPYGNELSDTFSVFVTTPGTTISSTTEPTSGTTEPTRSTTESNTTVVSSTTPTTSTSTTSPPPTGIDPILTLIIGLGIGGTIVVVIVIIIIRKKS